jgi:hypothetical protein
MQSAEVRPVVAKVWKKCGHRRTADNTRCITARQPGGECRKCAVERDWKRDVFSINRTLYRLWTRPQRDREARLDAGYERLEMMRQDAIEEFPDLADHPEFQPEEREPREPRVTTEQDMKNRRFVAEVIVAERICHANGLPVRSPWKEKA